MLHLGVQTPQTPLKFVPSSARFTSLYFVRWLKKINIYIHINSKMGPGKESKSKCNVQMMHVYVYRPIWSVLSVEYHMHQPGGVARLACGQLNREMEYLPAPVRTSEFGIARRVPSLVSSLIHPTQAESDWLVLTHGITPAFRDGVLTGTRMWKVQMGTIRL